MMWKGRQKSNLLMPAGSNSLTGHAVQAILVLLVTGMATAPLCLSFPDLLADVVLSKLESQYEGQQDQTVLGALYLQNECSDELPECQKPEALADPSTLRCFTICIDVETGCRSCCSGSTCYHAPEDGGSLGSCIPCQHDTRAEQCALTSALHDHVFCHGSCALRRSSSNSKSQSSPLT
jgi:hypothetical protein